MSYLRYEQQVDLRALERTPYRYVPNNCLYCGYNTSPSLSKSSCVGCSINHKSKNNNGK